MEVTAEALNSPLQGKLQAIVILVKDLDLIAGFTDRHTPILSPEMLKHAIFPDPKIPLRTRIFLDRRNRLLFLLQIPGREYPTWLLFGLAGVDTGFFRRCVFFWRCSLVILVKDPKLLAVLTKHEAAVGSPDIFIYAILAEREKDLVFILQGYARRNILVISSRFMFPVKGITVILPSAWDRRLVDVL